MQILNTKTSRKIEAIRPLLEKRLRVSLDISGKKIEVSGEEYDKFIAEKVIDAIDKNFNVETALLIQNESYVFESLNIKDYTRKKNLTLVIARVIGKNGRTIQIIGELSNCELTLTDHYVNIIGPADKIKFALNAVTSLIQGAKTSKVYAYLEKSRNKPLTEDLGLKIKLPDQDNK